MVGVCTVTGISTGRKYNSLLVQESLGIVPRVLALKNAEISMNECLANLSYGVCLMWLPCAVVPT